MKSHTKACRNDKIDESVRQRTETIKMRTNDYKQTSYQVSLTQMLELQKKQWKKNSKPTFNPNRFISRFNNK